MNVTFRFFASCRETVGKRELTANLPEGSTVASAQRWLDEQYPALEKSAASIRVAVNRCFVASDHPLNDGDEVALIPPVSGGSGTRVLLSDTPVSANAAAALVSQTGSGALVTFTGVVRPTSKMGRAVTSLDYETYPEMALEKLQTCLDEAGAQWPVLDSAIVHRLGHLEVGEVAVSVAVVSAHRKEAFHACQFIIDRLKEIVPIWKKETGPEGAEWVSEGA